MLLKRWKKKKEFFFAASFASRAVTLHIYSKPFDTCEVYDLKARRYQEVALVNTSEYGVVKSDS